MALKFLLSFASIVFFALIPAVWCYDFGNKTVARVLGRIAAISMGGTLISLIWLIWEKL